MLNLAQAGSETTSIYLSPEQGRRLRQLIEQSIDSRFSTYVNKAGNEGSQCIAPFVPPEQNPGQLSLF